MLKEGCSNCGLTTEVKVIDIQHDSNDERIVQAGLEARFSCTRCNIDRTSSMTVIRIIHDLSTVRDPELLRSTLEAIESASPGNELIKIKIKILSENCPLYAKLRISDPL